MSLWGLLFCILLLLASFCTAQSAHTSPCHSFLDGFPTRLKTLREKYFLIREYYEANDDMEFELLDENIQDTFRSPFACNAMSSILDFYLRTVLPAALDGVTQQNIPKLQPHVEDIQLIFYQLKTDVTRCKRYFSCKKPFDIHALNSTYTQMQSKGLFKAMNELDLLFSYFEDFLAPKWQRNHI